MCIYVCQDVFMTNNENYYKVLIENYSVFIFDN